MTLIWYLENMHSLREKEDSKIKFECREGPSSFTALCLKLLSKHKKKLALVIDPITFLQIKIMGTFESIFLISLAIIIMIFQNIFFGLFNIYVIKEHETSLQRLLNILYFLLALVIQVSWLDDYKPQPETR